MRERIRSALAGRYVLERELGRGASATVYSARDLKHGRRVALKVLDPAIASTIGHGRFLREIRTTAALNHPHILPLFDSDEVNGFIYYTMPLVEGESLRARLARSGPLSLETVRHFTFQIADALAAAHAAGVVHRDVKPENILITAQDHVWVCDFGLARALTSAVDREASAAALIVGSPQYMSPEQAAGRQDIDARSDVYSLACTVFEMLAGIPPFTEGDAAALLRRHMTEEPPKLGSVRDDVPPSVEMAVRQALSKSPSQRFPDASAFAAALAATDQQTTSPASVPTAASDRPRRRRVVILALLAAAVLVPLAWLVAQDPMNWLSHAAVEADTSLFVILPLDREEGLAEHDEEQSIRDALERWTDVRVVDGFQLRDALLRRGPGSLSLSESRELARELQAGRLVRGSVSRAGDSLLVRTTLFAVAGGRRPLSESQIRVPADGGNADHAYLRLVDALLFSSTGGNLTAATYAGTTSRRARHAFLAGERALWEWDLESADSLFLVALNEDSSYPEALLLRAQIRFWLEGPGEPAQRAAEAAWAAADRLPAHERRKAEGLLALARRDFPAACQVYGEILRDNPRDFVATRGMAECHQFDRRVTRDSTSPTGWSFRSSGHQALQYHIRAFRLVPASHRAFRAGRFLKLRNDIFYTALASYRSGRTEDGEAFGAHPSWNDTLALHPVPLSQLGVRSDGSGVTAVTQLRRLLLDVTEGWVAAHPRSADALEAHAIAMELQGDTTRAIETLERARTFTDDPEHRLHLSISEFWLRLKRALPGTGPDTQHARALADTLIRYAGPMDATGAERLAAVAAVTGRVHRAASLARAAARSSSRPLGVAEAGGVLLAYASLGGPADSIAAYEDAVEIAVRNLLAESERLAARAELLGRAAPLALPAYEMKFINEPRPKDYVLDAIALLGLGDHGSVRQMLADVAGSRAHARPADIMLEGLLTEAWLFVQMNDIEAAAARLGPTLDEISWVEPGALETIPAAGSLARAMLLRAQIAHAMGDDATARRWAAAFAELWRNADEELQPRVREARRIME